MGKSPLLPPLTRGQRSGSASNFNNAAGRWLRSTLTKSNPGNKVRKVPPIPPNFILNLTMFAPAEKSGGVSVCLCDNCVLTEAPHLSLSITDLASIVSSNRQSGIHVPVQPSASQFFSSIDHGMSDASSMMSSLGSSRQSGQHQFQDTFPGRHHTIGL